MLDEDGAVAVVGWRWWWTRIAAVVVAVVANGFHSPLPFLCCTLKIDVDIVCGTLLSLYGKYGRYYHHS
jgi:hypothetical protein